MAPRVVTPTQRFVCLLQSAEWRSHTNIEPTTQKKKSSVWCKASDKLYTKPREQSSKPPDLQWRAFSMITFHHMGPQEFP